MRSSNVKSCDNHIESLSILLQAIINDPVVNKKVSLLLKMESYPRRIVLSNWLEKLQQRKASEKLVQTLSLLFDDKIAKQVMEFISKYH